MFMITHIQAIQFTTKDHSDPLHSNDEWRTWSTYLITESWRNTKLMCSHTTTRGARYGWLSISPLFQSVVWRGEREVGVMCSSCAPSTCAAIHYIQPSMTTGLILTIFGHTYQHISTLSSTCRPSRPAYAANCGLCYEASTDTNHGASYGWSTRVCYHNCNYWFACSIANCVYY
jgi:hypothetical protein